MDPLPKLVDELIERYPGLDGFLADLVGTHTRDDEIRRLTLDMLRILAAANGSVQPLRTNSAGNDYWTLYEIAEWLECAPDQLYKVVDLLLVRHDWAPSARRGL